MAQIQYKTTVSWDITLIDIGYADSMISSGLKGLAVNAVKITTGAPAANSGRFIAGAFITNSTDGTTYENTGSTNSPVWTLVAGSGGGGFSNQIVLAGSGTAFALPSVPAGLVLVYAEGQLLVGGGADYALSGTFVTTTQSWPAGSIVAIF